MSFNVLNQVILVDLLNGLPFALEVRVISIFLKFSEKFSVN